jgi:hypothetical protein
MAAFALVASTMAVAAFVMAGGNPALLLGGQPGELSNLELAVAIMFLPTIVAVIVRYARREQGASMGGKSKAA